MVTNVLLVDDDANLLESLKRSLRHESYALLTAGSVSEALRLLRENQVAVVVTDQSMVGLSGVDLLETVREQWPDTARFLLTGNATREVALAAINDGQVARLFEKPCDARELAAAIRHAIENRLLGMCARRLLGRVRAYQAALARLEADHPGISRLRRDADRAIVVEDPVDVGGLVREIARELDDPDLAPADALRETSPLTRKDAG